MQKLVNMSIPLFAGLHTLGYSMNVIKIFVASEIKAVHKISQFVIISR